MVIAGGKVIVEDGKFVGKKGDGRFLKRGHSMAATL
jgi:N-acyl-D-aspartate/D-glutamate deacylase